MLGRTMHGIDYDPVHDEIVVPQQFGQAILTFDGAARGEQLPKRVIQGPLTQLRALDRLAVDPLNDEIYVPEGQRVLVFDRGANGNVAPKRILGGPATGFSSASAVAIDPVRNLVVIGGSARVGGEAAAVLAIFSRTASGNAKPIRVITGAEARLSPAGNMRIHPESGMIFVVQQGPGYVGVWSIEDSGAAPPRFTIGGPDGALRKPRGLDLDPKNNAVIISDKELNAVLTYELPAVFEKSATASAR